MKKLIIFDCDGTLVDSEYIASRVFPAVFTEMGLPMTRDEFISKFVGASVDAPIVKDTLAKLPPHAMEVADKKFEEELRLHLKAINGIKELLNELSHNMCVASNSSHPYVIDVLTRTDLITHFEDRVFSSRDLANPKPAPDVFLHAAKSLGYTVEDCVVVEDSKPGIMAAKAAKMKVIGFTGAMHFNEALKKKLYEADADIYCDTVDELRKNLLEFK